MSKKTSNEALRTPIQPYFDFPIADSSAKFVESFLSRQIFRFELWASVSSKPQMTPPNARKTNPQMKIIFSGLSPLPSQSQVFLLDRGSFWNQHAAIWKTTFPIFAIEIATAIARTGGGEERGHLEEWRSSNPQSEHWVRDCNCLLASLRRGERISVRSRRGWSASRTRSRWSRLRVGAPGTYLAV